MAPHILLFNCTGPISSALSDHSIFLVLDQPRSDAFHSFETAFDSTRTMRWLQFMFYFSSPKRAEILTIRRKIGKKSWIAKIVRPVLTFKRERMAL